MLKKLIVALGASAPVLLAGNVLPATLPNLPPGSQFRYLFITSTTRNATSTNIADDNTFVNNAASVGTATQGITGPWAAIGSTATVNARDNTATTGTGGVPIYRVDGTLLANDYGDLWDGSLLNTPNIDENGGTSDDFAWTGTNSNGSTSTFPLGNSGKVISGYSMASDSNWITTIVLPEFISTSIYAMSPIQEIPSDPVIPEPTTIIASLLVGAGLLPLKRRRQKTK